jgi:hypothetical protein
MTATDYPVSHRPQTAATTIGRALHDHRDPARRRRAARRGLLAVPLALALMIPAAPALGQTSGTGTSGYNQKPPVKTTPEPKSGAAPAKTTTTPTATTPKTSPEPVTTTPAKTAVSPTSSALPFTGLDLRWVLGAGLLLLAAGLSIRVAQRRGARR